LLLPISMRSMPSMPLNKLLASTESSLLLSESRLALSLALAALAAAIALVSGRCRS